MRYERKEKVKKYAQKINRNLGKFNTTKIGNAQRRAESQSGARFDARWLAHTPRTHRHTSRTTHPVLISHTGNTLRSTDTSNIARHTSHTLAHMHVHISHICVCDATHHGPRTAPTFSPTAPRTGRGPLTGRQRRYTRCTLQCHVPRVDRVAKHNVICI